MAHSRYWLGKKRPDISAAQKGRVFSPETIEKMRQAKLKNPTRYWLGKTRPNLHTEEWKHELAERQRGNKSHFWGSDKSGSNNPRWITDRTKVKLDKERGGPLHKQWSKYVKNRDGWRCRIANSDCSGRVVAHHILSWAEHPKLRYQINNGIALCHAHHPRKRAEEKRLVPTFLELVAVSN